MRQRTSVLRLEELESRLLLKAPFEAPSLGAPPPPGPNVIWIPAPNGVGDVGALQNAVRNLQSNQTIVLQRGIYYLGESLFIGRGPLLSNVTIRGETDDYNDVIIHGRGMDNLSGRTTVPHGFSIETAQDVLIANLSVGEVWHHPIQFQGGAGAADRVRIYHCRLFNGGEQLIKANPGAGGADDVILEYSVLEYTGGTPQSPDHSLGVGYTNGISAFEADRWIIRHNLFRNFHTPDTSAWWYNPAVLMWGQSTATTVEGNTFVNVDRAIYLGLGDTPGVFDHAGGVIRNNFIWMDPGLFSAVRRSNADAPIGVIDSPDTKVYHNTVMTNGNHPLAIEVRFVGTNVEFRNNLTDRPLGSRNGGFFAGSDNYTNATADMFAVPYAGDLHLISTSATVANVIDRAPVLTGAPTDWDETTRPLAANADIGADEYQPRILRVTSFTPTTTGFTAEFNLTLNTAVLNLYDGDAASLGPADVTVVGTVGGPLQGSLEVDPTSARITFITTGGPLAPDTYTVTLRSAANAFQWSVNGQLLDGDNDGNPGGNFTNTFTYNPPLAFTLTIPDITRGPGQPVNLSSTGSGLPLRLDQAVGVRTVQLTLTWNPALLTLQGASMGPGLPAGSTLLVNFQYPGRSTIVFAAGTTLPLGGREIIIFNAQVPDTAPYGAKHVLNISDLLINGYPTGTREDDGLHVVSYLGDTTGNGAYGATDAQRALRVAVGLDSGFPAYQLADPAMIADINGGGVTSTDATRILQEVVGIDQPQIIPLPSPPLVLVSGGIDPLLNIPRTFRARPGKQITVPVNLDYSDTLEAVDLALSFDTSRLEAVAVRRGRLTRDFDLFAATVDPETGGIRVGMARTAGPISGRGSGSVLRITFRVKTDAPAGPAVINLRQALGNSQTHLNDGGLDLIPDPSNEAGDVLDGLITVPEQSRKVRGPSQVAGRSASEAARAGLIDAVFAGLGSNDTLRRRRR